MNKQSSNPQKRAVKILGLLSWLLLLPIGFLVRIWGRTLRFRFRSEAERKVLEDQADPMVILLWHNRLFLASEIYRRHRSRRKVFGMVSASNDGAWLAAFFRMLGINSVRGSRHFRGTAALRSMMGKLSEGHDVAVTPDGSRGPFYEMKPGVLLLSKLAKCPVLLLSSRFSNAWRLKSWDQFYLPKPFSLVEIRCERLSNLEESGINSIKQEGCATMKSLMDQLTTDPD